MAHGAHFLCETRPMIDFQIGHARYVGPFRYLGRRKIFPTQTLRAAGICVFSTQTSEGDLDENCNLQKAKSRAP